MVVLINAWGTSTRFVHQSTMLMSFDLTCVYMLSKITSTSSMPQDGRIRENLDSKDRHPQSILKPCYIVHLCFMALSNGLPLTCLKIHQSNVLGIPSASLFVVDGGQDASECSEVMRV